MRSGSGVALVLLFVVGWAPSSLRAQTDLWLVPISAEASVGTPIPVATRPGYENQPSFSLNGRRLYFTANLSGRLTCLDAKTGKPVLDRVRLPGIHQIYASPVNL